jgi:hypothetical protein
MSCAPFSAHLRSAAYSLFFRPPKQHVVTCSGRQAEESGQSRPTDHPYPVATTHTSHCGYLCASDAPCCTSQRCGKGPRRDKQCGLWLVFFSSRQLDIRTDSAELKESLASLSTFYTHKNTVESRRQLRSELEAEGLRIARDFIGEFSDLEAVGTRRLPHA